MDGAVAVVHGLHKRALVPTQSELVPIGLYALEIYTVYSLPQRMLSRNLFSLFLSESL